MYFFRFDEHIHGFVSSIVSRITKPSQISISCAV